MSSDGVADDIAPGASPGTVTSARRMSEVSNVVFVDKWIRVSEGAAIPVPILLVVTVTPIDEPAPPTAGTVNVDTITSGGIFGVAAASFESPLTPNVFSAETT